MYSLPRKAINLADCLQLQLLAFYNKTSLRFVTVSMFQQHSATGDQFVDSHLWNFLCIIYNVKSVTMNSFLVVYMSRWLLSTDR